MLYTKSIVYIRTKERYDLFQNKINELNDKIFDAVPVGTDSKILNSYTIARS
jgi:RNA-splicing ligase RtcB